MHKELEMPSYQKLKILISMRNFRIITFKEQNIYKNLISFKLAMKELHKKGFVVIRRINGSLNEYKLTEKGNNVADGLNELAE